MKDLAIIVVSTNEAHWLPRCLSTILERAGSADIEVVVADNSSTDGTVDLVRSEYPQVRVVSCRNLGFSHANNRGLITCDARYVLFLNPDTEVTDGTFGELVRVLDERPRVGLAGVRQVTSDGTLWPTMRRFPNALRALGEAIGVERAPVRPAWAGERLLDPSLYERETPCDWVSGSFMVLRREALEGAGFLDERFFIYSEETDLALRVKRGGWEVLHLPQMTIIHHAGKKGISAKMEAQNAYARLQYARKHFSAAHRWAYLAAVALRYLLRASMPDGASSAGRRVAARRALRTLVGREGPPFGAPPSTSVARREDSPLRVSG